MCMREHACIHAFTCKRWISRSLAYHDISCHSSTKQMHLLSLFVTETNYVMLQLLDENVPHPCLGPTRLQKLGGAPLFTAYVVCIQCITANCHSEIKCSNKCIARQHCTEFRQGQVSTGTRYHSNHEIESAKNKDIGLPDPPVLVALLLLVRTPSSTA